VHPSLAIAAKDLRQKVRDRSAIILSVVAPLTLALAFSSALPGDQASFSATFVVADLDGGRVARSLVDGPLAALGEVGVTVEAVADEATARGRIDDESADAAIVIPAGFSAAVEAAQPSEIRIVGSVNATLATQVAEAVVNGFATGVEAVQVAVGTVVGPGTSPDPATIAEIAAAALRAPDPVRLVADQTADRLAGSSTYYGASMAVLFLFFAAQFGVVSIHAERRVGTLARMLAAPVSARAVLAGKVLVSVVLGVVSVAIVAVGTTVLMGASWGDPVAVAALVGSIALAASGIALLAVGFTRNEDQASGLTAIVAMILAILGGSFFPLSQAPEGLAQLSLITPHAWFLRGIDDLAAGGGITVVLPSIAVLIAIGTVSGGLGLLRAQRLVAVR
jgi:ABC-2 type transport system permease protein